MIPTLISGLCSLLLVACSTSLVPAAISTEHEYVLARFAGDTLVKVEGDDPLYERFDEGVLSDPYLHQLLTVFDDTTEAFWATNRLNAFPQTVANKLVIVVNSPQAEVLHDVAVEDEGRKVTVELALGLGQEGKVNLAHARQAFAPTMAGFLWELMGLPPSNAPPVVCYKTTDPSAALKRGFQTAIETMYWERRIEEGQSLKDEVPEAPSALHALVAQNTYRHRFVDGMPSADLRSHEEALRTPGAVATFFYRLLQRANAAYPQRHMLWFTNYEDANVAHAKVLFALSRTPGSGGASVQHFIEAYAEAFPAEREMIHSLTQEVFGQSASTAATIPSGNK